MQRARRTSRVVPRASTRISKPPSSSKLVHRGCKSQHRLHSSLHHPGVRQFTSKSKPSAHACVFPVTIAGIETSCDDTGVAVINDQRKVLSNAALSQLAIHQIHGGVVPTMAMRQHAITINHLVAKSFLEASVVAIDHDKFRVSDLQLDVLSSPPEHARFGASKDGSCQQRDVVYLSASQSNIDWLESQFDQLAQFTHHLYLRGDIPHDIVSTAPFDGLTVEIDAIAATFGPGLSGSLGVGVDTAKAISKWLNIPLIPVNHIVAHTTVGSLRDQAVEYPYLGVVLSGGHTQMNYVEAENQVTVLGSTVDDAVGEAFDKIYRSLHMKGVNFSRIEEVIVNEKAKLYALFDHLYATSLPFAKTTTTTTITSSSSSSAPTTTTTTTQPPIHFPHLHTAEKMNSLLVSLTTTPPIQQKQQQQQQQLNSSPHHPLRVFQSVPNDIAHNKHLSDVFPSHLDGQLLEHYMIEFINNIQSIPDIHVETFTPRHIGHVTDLYNQHKTPDALHETFQLAQSVLEGSSSLAPLPNANKIITPQDERSILTAFSQQQNAVPHGAIIEKAARLYTDIHNILHCYDFVLQRVLHENTPLLDQWFYSLRSTPPNNGLLRKSSHPIPSHRFLPSVPLPLPLHNPGPTHSWTAMSMSGLKTKLRQYIENEHALMERVLGQSADAAAGASVPTFFHDFSVPIHLRYLLTQQHNHQAPPHQLNNHQLNNDDHQVQLSPSISNVFRLTCCSQLQSTVAEHLIDKITRVLQYLNCSLPQQQGVTLLASPQAPPLDASKPASEVISAMVPQIFQSSIFNPSRTFPIVVGGGVACNAFLTANIEHFFNSFSLPIPPPITTTTTTPTTPTTSSLEEEVVASNTITTTHTATQQQQAHFRVTTVPPALCGDNGIMIAWSGLQLYNRSSLAQPQWQPRHLSLTTTTTTTDQLADDSSAAFELAPASHDNRPETRIGSEISMVYPRYLSQVQSMLNLQFEALRKESPNNISRCLERFTLGYQQPRWPLFEVFIEKPAKPTRVSNSTKY